MWDKNETVEERRERWAREDKERREYLKKEYPVNKIQKLDIETLRKIGYAIGIGSTGAKRELIDKIIKKQGFASLNPIIDKDRIGEFYFNKEVKLMKYIKG